MTKPSPLPGSSKPQISAVSATVLEAFFDELSKTDGLAEIGHGLRKVVMGDGVLAEPAIHDILFPDAP